MITTKSIKKINDVETLFNLINERKEIEKKEKALKKKMKEMMAKEMTMKAGDFVVMRDQRERPSIDKNLLAEILNEDEIAGVTVFTEYEVLLVKKA